MNDDDAYAAGKNYLLDRTYGSATGKGTRLDAFLAGAQWAKDALEPRAPAMLVGEWNDQFGRHRRYSMKDRFGNTHAVTITRHLHLGWPDRDAAGEVRDATASANTRPTDG